MGSNDFNATQAPPPPQFWIPPEIDFFDVSDDLEQKKEFFLFVKFVKKIVKFCQEFFFLENVRKLPRRVRKRPKTAPQG